MSRAEYMRRAVMLPLFALLFAGCAFLNTWDDVMHTWIGADIARITNLWGEPRGIWTREDGMTIYKYELKKLDPSCVHYWVVSKEKIIVDFYYEGYCRPVG